MFKEMIGKHKLNRTVQKHGRNCNIHQHIVRKEENRVAMASEREFWWLRLKSGSSFKIFASELQAKDVYSILEVARTKAYLNVPIHKLMLFESEQDYHGGKALRNGLSVNDIRGGNDDLGPLYVSYPDECPDASSAQVVTSDIVEKLEKKLEKIAQGQEEKFEKIAQGQEKMQEKVIQTLLPLCQQAFELVPASSSSWDADWHAKVCEHYQLHGCIILSQAYPETHNWFCTYHQKSYFGFCVSEHIYHKKQARSAKALGIEIADPHNGLPLLKHFEVLYQDGDMTLFPCAEENPLEQERNTIRVKIHIAHA
eukprot:s557_g18.t1